MNEIQVVQEQDSILCNLDSMLKFAEIVAKSGLCPVAMDTKEKVLISLQMGKELGLPPMSSLNNIAVINGKPTLSADVMLGIARSKPSYKGLQWVEQNEKRAECVVSRMVNGVLEKTSGSYSIEDAERADLMKKDNWKKYPKRMLAKRALSYALRDAFSDSLSGVYTEEEIQSANDEEIEYEIIEPVKTFDSFDEPVATVKSTVKDFD